MTILVLVLALCVVGAVIRVGVRRRVRPTVAGLATPEDVEQVLTAQLLAGRLDREMYRDCMAAIASTIERDPAAQG